MDWKHWRNRISAMVADLDTFQRECNEARLYEPAGMASAAAGALIPLRMLTASQTIIAGNHEAYA